VREPGPGSSLRKGNATFTQTAPRGHGVDGDLSPENSEAKPGGVGHIHLIRPTQAPIDREQGQEVPELSELSGNASPKPSRLDEAAPDVTVDSSENTERLTAQERRPSTMTYHLFELVAGEDTASEDAVRGPLDFPQTIRRQLDFVSIPTEVEAHEIKLRRRVKPFVDRVPGRLELLLQSGPPGQALDGDL
jgi:hypothetical protein